MPDTNLAFIDTADVVAVAPVAGVRCVLLIQRHWPPFEGHWALPGGHVDPGEHTRDAAARELAEETNVPARADELTRVGVFDEPGRDPRGPYRTTAYVLEWNAAPRPAAAADARAACWTPIRELAICRWRSTTARSSPPGCSPSGSCPH